MVSRRHCGVRGLVAWVLTIARGMQATLLYSLRIEHGL